MVVHSRSCALVSCPTIYLSTAVFPIETALVKIVKAIDIGYAGFFTGKEFESGKVYVRSRWLYL